MAAIATDAEQIQTEMRQVRAELRDDVNDVVDSARVLSQWQSYVRSYPWLCLGAAAAAGFFLVPSRVMILRPDTESLMELAKSKKLVVNVNDANPKPGLIGSLIGMAAGTVMQAGLAIASQQVNQFLAAATNPPPPANREGAYR